MKRRLLATFLSLCLLVGLLPTVALATDEEPGAEPAPVCTCESLCTEGAADKTCPVCAADYTVCSYTAPAEPVEEPTEEPTVELEDAVRAREAAEAVHDEGCPLYVAPEDQSSALIVSLPDPAVIVEDDPADVDSWKNCRTCSEDNPHMIYTTADLDKIRTHYDDEIGSITGYFKLANDIVFDNADFAEGGAFYNGGKGFEPIGVYGKPVDGSTVSDGFRGVFDGDDNIISGVKIYNDGSYGQMTGLFGWPRKSKGADSCIKNLVLKNFDVEYTGTNESSYAAVGAIAGFSWTNDSENPITIDNCAVYDSSVRSINYECTDGTTNAVGGIVGRLNASSAKNCTVAGVEVSGLLSVGGVCGVSAGGVVDNCVVDSSSTKPTTVTGDIVGGVVGNQGSSYFKVLNSYSNCVVRLSADHKKYQRIGGIAGNDNPQSGMELGNNAAVVDIDLTQLDTTQTYAVGGLIGRVNGSQSRSNNHDDVWNVKFRNVPQGATIPMRQMCDNITQEKVENAIRLLYTTMVKAGIKNPRIAVAALNPHGGEAGTCGREEIDIMEPAMEAMRKEGYPTSGPYPADTVFQRAFRKNEFDGIVTMYHDQGQIALKLLGFEHAVSILGGLPMPVVTPAHGTAFEIAGQGIASVEAFRHTVDDLVSIVNYG